MGGRFTAESADRPGVCEYSTAFVDGRTPLTEDITLSASAGRHIFAGSVVVGANAGDQAGLAALGVSKGGDGPTLTIEAGVTVVFKESGDFMVINRGSQLIVRGTAAKPVVMTGAGDPAVGGRARANSVQLWGGLVINGFGVTNSCAYTGTRGQTGFALASAAGCHVMSEGLQEGRATHYGGINDADNSGSIEYLIVKHAGAEVAEDNELNGVTFNAVGSGTTVENLQVFRAYDDGIEFFGGAVNVSNYLALYVNDDSIDIDSGYRGTVNRALVIQGETDGNRCVEADGIASYSGRDSATIMDNIARELNSAPTLSNITCIVSASEGPDGDRSVAGTHDPGEGLRLREGVHPTLSGLVVTNAYSKASTALSSSANDVSNNWCLDIDSSETLAAANDGDLSISNSVFACSLAAGADGDMVGSMTELAWLEAETNVYVAALSPLLNPGLTTDPALALFAENSYTPLMLTQMALPGASALTLSSVPGYLGGASSDWTAGWTLGLDDLWFDKSQ